VARKRVKQWPILLARMRPARGSARRISSQMQWELDPCTHLVLLHTLGERLTDANEALQRHANRVLRSWTREKQYDVVWTWNKDGTSYVLTCEDLQGSQSLFPREFLRNFVGRVQSWQDGGWLLSTVSTK
jgi:hypothetical protein